MAIKGILFDKDGTLLDYNATWVPANRAVARMVARGDEVLAQRLLALGGQDEEAGIVKSGSLLAVEVVADMARFWEKYAPDHGFDDLTQAMEAEFQRVSVQTSVIVEGLHDVLSALKASGFRLGIATNDSAAGIDASLSRFDVLHHFDFIAGYDSGYGGKPGPGMAIAFAEACGLLPEEIAVVGDNTHDIDMGRNAGAGLNIGVLTGNSSREDLDSRADHVIGDIRGLEALLT